MGLPNLNNSYIIETTTLPDSGRVVKYHSMTANDAKVFIMLKDDVVFLDLLNNVKQVLRNCTEDLEPNDLSYLDLQWLFLKLRIASKGNISELNYVCRNKVKGEVCGTKILHELDLNEVKATKVDPERIEFVQVPNTDIRIYLKDIDVESLEYLSDDSGRINPNNLLDSIALTVDKIVEGTGDDSVVHSEFTLQDLNTFLGQCPSSVFREIDEKFIKLSPKLSHDIKLKCRKCGREDTETLEGLINFF